MRVFFIIIFSLVFCACQIGNRDRICKEEKIVNSLLFKIGINLKEKKGLIPCGNGAQMMDKIKMLALAFDCHKKLDIETGRELLVACVQEFAAEINTDERIRPFLNNFPFMPTNIQIEIYVHDSNYADFGPSELCVIEANRGTLRYMIHDPVTGRLTTIFQETYDEAIQKMSSLKT